jgi:hypothetical protein
MINDQNFWHHLSTALLQISNPSTSTRTVIPVVSLIVAPEIESSKYIHTKMFHSACLILFFLARESLGFSARAPFRMTDSCLYSSLSRTEADHAAINVNTRRNVLESFLSASLLSSVILTPSVSLAVDGVDYKAVAEDVAALVVKNPDWGPTLVRLAWHSSGTYDKMLKNGGSSGGTIRFKEELAHGGNAGLADTAVSWMDPIYEKYKDQGLSYADLYTLGGGKFNQFKIASCHETFDTYAVVSFFVVEVSCGYQDYGWTSDTLGFGACRCGRCHCRNTGWSSPKCR